MRNAVGKYEPSRRGRKFEAKLGAVLLKCGVLFQVIVETEHEHISQGVRPIPRKPSLPPQFCTVRLNQESSAIRRKPAFSAYRLARTSNFSVVCQTRGFAGFRIREHSQNAAAGAFASLEKHPREGGRCACEVVELAIFFLERPKA